MIKFDGMFVTEEHLKNAFESTLPEADDVTLLALLYGDSQDKILFRRVVDLSKSSFEKFVELLAQLTCFSVKKLRNHQLL